MSRLIERTRALLFKHSLMNYCLIQYEEILAMFIVLLLIYTFH